MKDTRTQIEIRREKVETDLQELRSRKKIKKRDDFRSDKQFENWKEKHQKKLAELEEELRILYDPADHNEIPLAVVATELGMSMSDVANLIREELMTASFVGEYRFGSRVTREELARVIEADPAKLLKTAYQSYEEIFEIGVRELHAGNLSAAEAARQRLDKNFDSYRLELLLNIGLCLATGDLRGIVENSELKYTDGKDLAALLKDLRPLIEPIKPADHLSAVFYEQLLAISDGINPKPFEDFFDRNDMEPLERMDENQRHAAFVAAVVMESIQKYKFKKYLESSRSYYSRDKEDELKRVIRDAVFTAFEAEQTYSASPSRKLFVDRFVNLFPKILIPAETTELFPRSTMVTASRKPQIEVSNGISTISSDSHLPDGVPEVMIR